MLSRSLGMPSRNTGPPSIWDTHMVYRETFLQIQQRLLQHLIRTNWIHGVLMYQNTHHHMWWVRTKHQFRIRDARSGPSARNSVVPSEGTFSKNYGADQQRLQISDPHFDKFSTSATFAWWKIRFKTEVCTCSQISHGSYALDQRSGVGWFSGWSEIFVFCKRNSASRERSVWRNEKPKKRTVSFVEHKSLSWSTSTSGSLEPTILSRIMPTYLQLFFEMMIFRNSIRNGTEFFYQWRKSHLMTSWKDLYKSRIRESEKLKTVLELYNIEIHQKKAGPDCHRLKTMVKRSIEHNLRIETFEARNGNYERNAVVKNQRVKQREQRTLGDCWQWKASGQYSKGDNSSFRHDINKRAKMTQPNPCPSSSTRQNVRNASRTRSPRGKSPSGGMSRLPCKDYLKGTCTNSFCEKWHPPVCLFYKSENGCRFLGKVLLCASPGWRTAQQKRSQKNGDKSAVAMLRRYTTIGLRISGYGAAEVFIDFAEELRHTENNSMCQIHQSRRTSCWHSRPKINRLEWFAQVILISVNPMLQILRIGLRKRRNGKSDVPVKQRGGWPKAS